MEYDQFADFNEIWNRVQSGGPNAAQAGRRPESLLERFMDGEAASEAGYRALARRWRNCRLSAVFCRLADDEAGHLRELETAYYLMTGDSYAPEKPDPMNTAMPQALRTMWLGERSAAEEYENAAEAGEANAEMFRRLAQDEERHSRILFCSLRNIME